MPTIPSDPRPELSKRCGPGEEYEFWWDGKAHEVGDNAGTVEAVKGHLGQAYHFHSRHCEGTKKAAKNDLRDLKSTLSRLNDALLDAHLGQINWTKPRWKNCLIYNGPTR